MNFGGAWAEYDEKVVCSGNPGQNIWNKLKKSIKIGQDYTNLISTFALFLNATVKL